MEGENRDKNRKSCPVSILTSVIARVPGPHGRQCALHQSLVNSRVPYVRKCRHGDPFSQPYRGQLGLIRPNEVAKRNAVPGTPHVVTLNLEGGRSAATRPTLQPQCLPNLGPGT